MTRQQRNTRQRQIVLAAVLSHRDHPTADQLYEEVSRHSPRIGRGTVYRNLHLLADNGEIRHVGMPGADRFDWRTVPHAHFCCTGCGMVCDVDVPYQADLDRQVEAQTGFSVIQHTGLFEGVCIACQRAGAGAR